MIATVMVMMMMVVVMVRSSNRDAVRCGAAVRLGLCVEQRVTYDYILTELCNICFFNLYKSDVLCHKP